MLDRVRAAARSLGPVVLFAALFAWAYRTTFPAPAPETAPAVLAPAAVTFAPAPVPGAVTEPAPHVAVPESVPLLPSPPLEESFPTAACPLSEHGFGAGAPPARVSSGWYTGDQFEQARREQGASSAAMVVYVYTDWCGYCREFERDLLADREVDGYLRDKVVKVRVNPETTGVARDVARQLGVEGYPSFFVFIPGAPPEKMALRSDGRLRSPDSFINGIESRMRRQADALLASASTLRREGSFGQALHTLNLVAGMRPDDPEVHLERGRVLAESGAPTDAFDALARAASLRPEDATPFTVTAEMLAHEERWDEVVACWTRFLDRNPSHAYAYLWRGGALARRGTPGLSQADRQRACQLGRTEACPHGLTTPSS